MSSEREWESKVTFLHKVPGNEIVQEHDKINSSHNMFVTASQAYPWNETKDISGEKVRLYDSLIFYKVRERVGNVIIPEDTFENESSNPKD